MLDTPFYIACLKLAGRKCLVVGGGDIGLEKVEGLLACDGQVALVAPDAIEPLQELAEEGSIAWERREYRPPTSRGRFMVIAATSDTDVNIGVYEDAERAGDARERGRRAAAVQLHPAGDHPHRAAGDRHLDSGRLPALAKRIRNEIAEEYGEPYAKLAVMLNEVRGWAKGTLPTYQDRKEFFESIVNGDPDPVELLRSGDERAVRDLIAAAQARRRPGLTAADRELSHLDEDRARPDGRRWRQGGDRPPGRGARAGANVAETAAAVARRRRAEGRRGLDRAARGIQAAKRTADLVPAMPSAARCRSWTCASRWTPTPAWCSIEAEARTSGADRRRDGGDDRLRGRRRHGLRHGQGDRARRRDRAHPADREVGRAARLAREAPSSMRAAVVTVSTSVAAGEAEDKSGPALAAFCREAGLDTIEETVTDERALIVAALKRLRRRGGRPLHLYDRWNRTDARRHHPGGHPRRDRPRGAWLPEAIRLEARHHTPLGLLTRGIAGIRGRTLIINLPGSPKAIDQSWPILEPTLRHAAETLERD